MTIPIQMSLHGFTATRRSTSRATALLPSYDRVAVEHYRKEADGSFTKLGSTFYHLVAFTPSVFTPGSGSGTTSPSRATSSSARLGDELLVRLGPAIGSTSVVPSSTAELPRPS
jgi:hypothetical protein